MLVDEIPCWGDFAACRCIQSIRGVKTSILWLDKTLARKTDQILFAKIEDDGFDLGAQRRPIKQNTYLKHCRQIGILQTSPVKR